MTAPIPAPGLLRECYARARGYAGLFRLPLRRRVWRGGAGDFVGRGTGASLDFEDHRAYAPGDDPRHINWQAYARTGQYSMKLFREEVRPLIDIVFDVSPSMFLTAEKAARSLELFYFAVESALRAGATPVVTAVAAGWHRALAVESVLGCQWPALLPSGPDEAGVAPDFARAPFRAQAMRVIVSDLLFSGEPEKYTALFSARQGRCVVFAPFCRAESDPDWGGDMEFMDAESLTLHSRRVESGLLRRYREAYARHFELWKIAALRHGLVIARVPAELDFPAALQMEALRTGAVEPWA